jgi:hypothetical protein
MLIIHGRPELLTCFQRFGNWDIKLGILIADYLNGSLIFNDSDAAFFIFFIGMLA